MGALAGALMLMLASGFATAAQRQGPAPMRVEVIELAHRPAEQVLPLLLPHLRERDLVVSGSGTRLAVSGKPHRVSEILALIDALDQPLRRLQITVAEGTPSEEASGLAGLRGSSIQDLSGGESRSYRTRRRDLVELPGDGAQSSTHIYTRRRPGPGYLRQIRVLEGEPASVFAGGSIARGGYGVDLQAQTGLPVFAQIAAVEPSNRLSVRAWLGGDQVTVEVVLAQQASRGNRDDARFDRSVKTTLRGTLGQWLQVTPAAPPARSVAGGARAFATSERVDGSLPVWLRVDQAGP